MLCHEEGLCQFSRALLFELGLNTKWLGNLEYGSHENWDDWLVILDLINWDSTRMNHTSGSAGQDRGSFIAAADEQDRVVGVPALQWRC